MPTVAKIILLFSLLFPGCAVLERRALSPAPTAQPPVAPAMANGICLWGKGKSKTKADRVIKMGYSEAVNVVEGIVGSFREVG